ncbi:MAG: DUF4011 domain-containing protein [Bacilli bacterium]|nr:DUF4011 domain-containing protein [Bacilli bacterium]
MGIKIFYDVDTYFSFVNFFLGAKFLSLSQNKKINPFAFINSLSIENDSDDEIIDVQIRVDFDEPSIQISPIKVPYFAPHDIISPTLEMNVDYAEFSKITRNSQSKLAVSVVDGDGNILGKEDISFTLCSVEGSFDRIIDKTILASFSIPSDEDVKAYLAGAAGMLYEVIGEEEDELGGYLYNDKERVKEEVKAIYLLLKNHRISRQIPPDLLSRVRLPHSISMEGEASSIDIALLFSSIIEADDLHPLLIILEDKTPLVGVWLNASGATSQIEDLSDLLDVEIQKDGNIFIFDPSGVFPESSVSFEDANELAKKKLKDVGLDYFLDINICHQEGIASLDIDSIKKADKAVNNNLPDLENGPKEKDKFSLWEEKLLDLDMRNNLINYRLGGNCLQFLFKDSSSFHYGISSGTNFSIETLQSQVIHGGDFLANRDYSSLIGDSEKRLASRTLTAISANGKSEDNIINLARKINTEIEESGVNPCFLTIGLIKWFPNEKAAKKKRGACYAPIILMPVSIPRHKQGNKYKIEIDADQIQFNTTFIEYLNQEFHLDISKYANPDLISALGIKGVFAMYRKEISIFENWEIIDNFSSLGHFSFAHYVMWSDMKNNHDLFLKNPIISALVNKETFVTDDSINVDLSETKLEDVAIPLDIDSSQLKAVIASEKGESFVLDGPPGTGKSQTIANMIVNFLYHKKKVLFVAQKEVALDIVKSKLEEIGLGVFCLQVASAKANKGDVLRQVGRAKEFGTVKEYSKLKDLSKNVSDKTSNINKNLEILHKENYCFSLYAAIYKYLSTESYHSSLSFEKKYINTLTKEKYEQAILYLERLIPAYTNAGGYKDNIFAPFTYDSYGFGIKDEMFAQIDSLRRSLKELRNQINQINKFTNLPIDFGKEGLVSLDRIALKIPDKSRLDYDFLRNEEAFKNYNILMTFLEKSIKIAEFRESTFSRISIDCLDDYEIDTITHRCTLADGKIDNIFVRLKTRALAKKFIKRYSLGKPIKDEIKMLSQIGVYRCNVADNKFPGYDNICLKESSYIKGLSERIEYSYAFFKKVLSKYGLKINDLTSVISQFISSYENDVHLDDIFASFHEKYLETKGLFENLNKNYGFVYPELNDENQYDRVVDSLEEILNNKNDLDKYTLLSRVLNEGEKFVPKSLIHAVKDGDFAISDIVNIYVNAVAYKLITVIANEEGLNNFDKYSFDQLIEEYRKKIDEGKKASITQTAAIVSANFPNVNAHYSKNTKIASLFKYISSTPRNKTLRKIFEECGEMIANYCPCFLMSPLSLAQYIAPGTMEFDVVIFDEASQIPTREAIGAIARGKSVIIAGDQKQMPPTNFFSKQFDIDDNASYYNVADDLESLLDDAIALNLPRRQLLFHYRSNHESLIAFSNKNFYNNHLLTFPSIDNSVSRLKYVYVDGLYERKKAINRAEADAIVNETIRRLSDPELSKKSIGIITFNESQQNLIDDMLSTAASFHPDIAPLLENVFVKNLENVQGDERDVILFSICYGRDPKSGKVSLNFGPLSKFNGERRLNVAITRARDELIVYASILPEEIRASEALNQGATYLKNFLSYAQNYNLFDWHHSIHTPSIADFVANDIKARGFEVEQSIGVSTFRVDLAIKRKGASNYILGVMIDKDPEQRTCRDRNVIEPKMLKRLGWRLYYLNSLDYLYRKVDVIDEICAEIEKEENNNIEQDAPVTAEFEKKEITLWDTYPHAQMMRKHKRVPKEKLEDTIRLIIEKEGPISENALFERYAEEIEMDKLTSKLKNAILKFINYDSNVLISEHVCGKTFYWRKNKPFITCDFFRFNVPSQKIVRKLTNLHPREIGCLIYDILNVEGRLLDTQLYESIRAVFNLDAIRKPDKEYIDEVYTYLMSIGFMGLNKVGTVFMIGEP